MSVRRGGVYTMPPVDREFLVVSIDALNVGGTAIVVEITDSEWSGPRSMLTVPLADTDPRSGRHVLAWRINWMRADRLGEYLGQVGGATLDRVVAAITAAIVP